jgi:methylglyoxal synthase/pSer/pThr/pTyr-binding forkhead associated (FHA) protein
MKVKVSTSQTEKEFEEVDLTQTTRRGSECLIGRSPDSDLVLDSDDVSRLHGKFFAQGGNYYFCDVGSRNGTIINGKLAERDYSYMLKDGDIIRIGDFVLMMEDEMPNSQQEETVVRIINPSVFSNWRQQNPSAVNHESVNSAPIVEISKPNEEVEVVNTSEETVIQSEETAVQLEDIVIPDNAIHSSDGISTPDVALQGTPEGINESDSIIQAHDPASVENDSITSEYTIVQVDDTPSAESGIEHESEAVEYTIVQVDDTPSAESGIEHESEAAEYTIVQVDDTPSAESGIEHENEAAEYTIVQVDDTSSAESGIEHENEAAEYTIVQVDGIPSAEETENIPNVEYEEEIAPNTQEEREIIEAINSDRQNLEGTPSQQKEELLLENASVLTSEHERELVATSQQTEQSEVQLAKILEEKLIILVSHDSKKSELVELVSEHEEFLSYCLTRTWQTFSDNLYKQTGLSVTQEIPPANSGGYQAINSLVNSGEILAVIFLRDLMIGPQPGQASEEALLRICNINNVLLATNLPTAKAILYYLKNLKD